MDKSRSTQITDTINKVDKSMSITGANLYHISFRIERPTEIDIINDNNDIYDLSLHGDYLSGVTPDILLITRKDKEKNSR